MTLPSPRCERPSARKRTLTPAPVVEEKLSRPTHLPPEGAESKFDAEEQPRRRSAQHTTGSPVIRSSRPYVLVRLLLLLSALSAVALLFCGGHERAEKIAVFREYLRQSRPALPAKLQGVWRLFDSEQRLDFVLHELPLDAALLGDSCDAGDERRLPLSGEAYLDSPQDVVPEEKRRSRFWRAEVGLQVPQELEELYLEAPQVLLEVNHSEGLLLRHRFDLLQPLRGGLGLPQQLCYALPNAQGPFGGEVLGCEAQGAPSHTRSSNLTVEVLLRSYSDPYVVASHLTRGCSNRLCSLGEAACLDARGLCFGRSRRLFRAYGLALLGLLSLLAAAEAMLSRASWQRLRMSVFSVLGLALLIAAWLLYR